MSQKDTSNGPSGDAAQAPVTRGVAVRSVVGGVLMGLANLVPGISGGTMLLASGVYPRFVGAVADVTSLRWRRSSFLVLALVVGAALVSVVALAGTVKGLVVDHRWIMYSLFIGLTLGGVPVVWKMIDRVTASVWLGAVAGFVVMAAVAVVQSRGAGSGLIADDASLAVRLVFMFLAGVVSASAMILPGISGGYLMLVLGVYVPVLGAIDAVKEAVRGGAFAEAADPAVTVILPLAVGTILGVVVVSNALKWLLDRYARATLGALLGLLVGAVVGLWPFQEGVRPEPGDVLKGRELTAEMIAELDPEDWPTQSFTPTAGHVAGAIGIAAAGFAATAAIARFGKGRDAAE